MKILGSTLLAATAGLLVLSFGGGTVAHAKGEITASTLETMCVSETVAGITSCTAYIDGVVSVMKKICVLQKQGRVHTDGFLALDMPQDVNTFAVVDVFLKSMDVSEFRHEWGGQAADAAVFFAASERWPCYPE